MCKHLNLAIILSERELPIEERRQQVAMQLFQENMYIYNRDGGWLQVMRIANDFCSVVDLDSMHCTCFAASRSYHCICLRVANLVTSDIASETESSVETSVISSSPRQVEADDHTDESKTDAHQCAKLNTKDLIEKLHLWGNSADFKDTPQIKYHLEQAYSLAFGAFTPLTRKRKVRVLEPHRQAIKRRDHAYHSDSQRVKPKIKKRVKMPNIDFHNKKGSCSVKRRSRAPSMQQLFTQTKSS